MSRKHNPINSVGERMFKDSARQNGKEHMQYVNRLTELSISMFEWKNLPPTIDARYLELALFHDGQAIFFKDDVLGFLSLKCQIAGQFDVYMIPNERMAYAPNGYNRKLTSKDSVIIWNNLLRTPSILDVDVFSRRLYELDRTIEVNAKAQKTPVLIKCDEKQRLTMLNLYKKYDGNEPFIFADKALDDGNFKVLLTNAPYVADKLYQLKTETWNEALTYLGISNVNITKRERLITDEVTRNQGGVMASRYSRLVSRQNACKQINEMFGLDIWCEFREDYNIVEDKSQLIESKGEEDEQIHNGD